jgi:hypothetical protein
MTTLDTAALDAVLDRHFAAEEAEDVDGILATLAHDAAHDAVGDPAGRLEGHDAIRARYKALFADLEEEGVTTIRRLYGDGFVVDESLWRGRAIGRPFGFDGGGRPLQFRMLHVCEVADGKLSSEQVWFDLGAVVQQLST